jgi:hypothetical protein
MDQVSIKYTIISHYKTLQNLPKFGFLVWKQTIWQPCVHRWRFQMKFLNVGEWLYVPTQIYAFLSLSFSHHFPIIQRRKEFAVWSGFLNLSLSLANSNANLINFFRHLLFSVSLKTDDKVLFFEKLISLGF